MFRNLYRTLLVLCVSLSACGSEERPAFPAEGPEASPARSERERLDPEEQVAEARRRLRSPEREVRQDAISTLIELSTASALEALLDVLQTERDPELRAIAVAAVRAWRDPEGLQHMELALGAADPELRRKAAENLASLGEIRAIPVLEEAWVREDDERVREAILAALRDLDPDFDAPHDREDEKTGE
jgi:HEAT repeat protein